MTRARIGLARPSLVAVIVAVPALSAVATPVAATTLTVVMSELPHVTVGAAIATPSESDAETARVRALFSEPIASSPALFAAGNVIERVT